MLPQLSSTESSIELTIAFLIDKRVSYSNAIDIQIKNLPTITYIDPLYTPTKHAGNMINIRGTNFENGFTYLIIDDFWEVAL